MGLFDSAANGLAQRLQQVGVPFEIAYAMGQVAYVSPRKRHSALPLPIASKSEVAWLVSQYEEQLRGVGDPTARMALIKGLCVRVFGSQAEEVFSAGYPYPAPHSVDSAPSSGQHKSVDDEFDADMAVYALAARYIGYEFDDEVGASQFTCIFPTDGGYLTGYCVVLGGTVGFYETGDLFANDTAEGSPIVRSLAFLTGCSVKAPPTADLGSYKFTEVQYDSANDIFLRLDFDRTFLIFAVPYQQLEPDEQDDVEVALKLALDVFDKQLAASYSKS